MAIEVSLQAELPEDAGEKVVVPRDDFGMIYEQPGYQRFLGQILPLAERWTLTARLDGTVAGTFVFHSRRWRDLTVLNAQPYFGSHGGPVTSAGLSGVEQAAVDHALGQALRSFVQSHAVDAVNVVEHPWRSAADFAEGAGLRAWDQRIGQISMLPVWRGREQTSQDILALCKQKSRNLVRKGLKQGFEIGIETSRDAWAELSAHHRISMAAIGGRAKQENEFDALKEHLADAGAAQLYTARCGGDFAGALLVLTHGPWVEYFVPVSVQSYRATQVLSALIHEAMLAACAAGARYWNWGGTWQSQGGVYRFKSGWGAEDFPYRYWGWLSDAGLALDVDGAGGPPEYFYVKPFGETDAA